MKQLTPEQIAAIQNAADTAHDEPLEQLADREVERVLEEQRVRIVEGLKEK